MSKYSTGCGFCPVYSGQLELEALPLYVLLLIPMTFQMKVEIMNMSKQVGSDDCELYAIAFATALSYEMDPTLLILSRAYKLKNRACNAILHFETAKF